MSDIVERLRAYASDDHERGCHGREYTCSCGYDDKRDPLLEEAADEIARLRAATQWRPIESAPKDGTPVLVGWNAGGWEPSKCHCEDGVWGHLTHEMGFLPCDPQPTHWLPLPPPPAISKEGGE